MKHLIKQIKNGFAVKNGIQLLRLLYTIEDHNDDFSWRQTYSDDELKVVYDVFEIFKDAYGKEYVLTPVWMLKEFCHEWSYYKDFPQIKELLKIIVRKHEEKQA